MARGLVFVFIPTKLMPRIFGALIDAGVDERGSSVFLVRENSLIVGGETRR